MIKEILFIFSQTVVVLFIQYDGGCVYAATQAYILANENDSDNDILNNIYGADCYRYMYMLMHIFNQNLSTREQLRYITLTSIHIISIYIFQSKVL